MAYGTDLRDVLREVIRGLLEFAKARAWNDHDYWIYYQLNEDVDRINIVFVAREFNDKDDFTSYRAVWESLQNQMAAHPEDLRRVNLVVHSESQVQQGGIYSIGRDYNEYFTFYPSGTFS
jgi:hypothetical protein